MVTPPDLLINRVQLIAEALNHHPSPATELTAKLPQLAPGQHIRAKVEAVLPDGNFRVVIAGQQLQMNLPRNIKPGDVLELVFLSSQPRLTFVLSSDYAARQPAPSSVSNTGRFIDSLLHHTSGKPGTATQLAGGAPIISGAPADAKELAGLLRNALSHSGLFYESHQAQWVTGERPLAQLLQEPQGKLSKTKPGGEMTMVVAGKNQEAADIPAQRISEDPAFAAPPRNREFPAHPDTLPLVQQQLHALETGQLVWRGEIWPNQWMEWDVLEQPPQENEQGGEPAWQTGLRLAMPQLGEVAATLRLDAGGLHIALNAATENAAGLLRKNGSQLLEALEAAGVRVAEMTVSSDAQA